MTSKAEEVAPAEPSSGENSDPYACAERFDGSPKPVGSASASAEEPLFRPSYCFPSEQPLAWQPWKDIRFKDEPDRYLKSVYAYLRAGNVVDGKWVTDARYWFHAPYMDETPYYREALHGLTRERSSRPKELHFHQEHCAQNWAVSVYNEVGAYTLGQVWNQPQPCAVDAARVRFPEGTVAAKLLFTTAGEDEVPYLRKAYEWQAQIHKDRHLCNGDPKANAFMCRATSPEGDPACKRRTARVRLIQIDLAVKDDRATEGWVFGSLVYNGYARGGSPWDKMVPLGLAWGRSPAEVRILEAGHSQHLGCKGRLNGPVDSPKGSCFSCHGRARHPYDFDFSGAAECMLPKGGSAPSPAPATPPAGPERSLDFSLQLAMGLLNHCDVQYKAPPQDACECGDKECPAVAETGVQ